MDGEDGQQISPRAPNPTEFLKSRKDGSEQKATADAFQEVSADSGAGFMSRTTGQRKIDSIVCLCVCVF